MDPCHDNDLWVVTECGQKYAEVDWVSRVYIGACTVSSLSQFRTDRLLIDRNFCIQSPDSPSRGSRDLCFLSNALCIAFAEHKHYRHIETFFSSSFKPKYTCPFQLNKTATQNVKEINNVESRGWCPRLWHGTGKFNAWRYPSTFFSAVPTDEQSKRLTTLQTGLGAAKRLNQIVSMLEFRS